MLLRCNRRAVGAAAMLLFAASVSACADERIGIETLDLSHVEQGWGKPGVNHSVDGHAIKIAGKPFEHGLGTHSVGLFLIDLSGGSKRFTASVGIDDEVGKRGSAEFTVAGDGKVLWTSGVMHGGDPSKPLSVDVTGVKKLALLIGDAGDGFEYDHADWADATLEVVGTHPKAATPANSNPVLAAPQTYTRPHITSPGLAGSLPGTPFLYTITAGGQQPIKFGAKGLPAGLKLDASTGKITGKTPAAGNYRVAVSAANAAGCDKLSLEIRSGQSLALSPPLGWNSYDCFGDDVTEAEVLENAAYINTNLKQHGWDYVIVDYRWYDPEASRAPNDANIHQGKGLTLDKWGRLMPSANRFPSAAGEAGFRPLASKIHGMGLRFGIHIMRGIPRQAVLDNMPIEGSPFTAQQAGNQKSLCPWCTDMFGVDAEKPAGQAYYDSLLRLYASWGVDYIKVDDMSAPYSRYEIEAVHKAIAKCGRSIVFSLSPGETPVEDGQHVGQNANLWRISGDFWDNWGAVNHQFDLLRRWAGLGGIGHWPDADMIPLGHVSVKGRSVGPDRHTGLTRDEQLTMMSLWAIAPSPMMLGMHLPDNDAWTLSLITNDEVLAINQDSAGLQAVPVKNASQGMGSVEIWKRMLSDGSIAVGVFNRIGAETLASLTWKDLGVGGPAPVRDLWNHTSLHPVEGAISIKVGAHGAALLRVYPGR